MKRRRILSFFFSPCSSLPPPPFTWLFENCSSVERRFCWGAVDQKCWGLLTATAVKLWIEWVMTIVYSSLMTLLHCSNQSAVGGCCSPVRAPWSLHRISWERCCTSRIDSCNRWSAPGIVLDFSWVERSSLSSLRVSLAAERLASWILVARELGFRGSPCSRVTPCELSLTQIVIEPLMLRAPHIPRGCSGIPALDARSLRRAQTSRGWANRYEVSRGGHGRQLLFSYLLDNRGLSLVLRY